MADRTADAPSVDAPAQTIDLVLTGTAVLPEGLTPDTAVQVDRGRILYAGPANEAPEVEPRERIAHDGLILPGLVDLHCHGGGGESFPDCDTADAAQIAIDEHRAHGTTSLVASLVTADAAELRDRVAMLADLADAGELAGIHLEGPFISPARKGAQNPAHIVGGDAALTRELCEIGRGHVATMTLAPETAETDAVIEALAGSGALPSLGHTDCTAAQMEHAIAVSRRALAAPGVRSALPTATHLFNGMRPVHHRDPGPVMACLDAASRGGMTVEVIGDGVHTAPETIRYAFDLAAAGQVVLVTDAMAAAGMPDGRYRLGALDVTVSGGVARLTDGGSIAGGTAHLLDVVRIAVEAGVPLEDAVRAASAVPARVLGIDDRVGSLAAGMLADIVLVDDSLREAALVLRADDRG